MKYPYKFLSFFSFPLRTRRSPSFRSRP